MSNTLPVLFSKVIWPGAPWCSAATAVKKLLAQALESQAKN